MATGRRGRQRIAAIIPVRIWGTDREGNPFSEHVVTMDISGHGARVGGVRAALAVGDTVGLQYRARQARFRIRWVRKQSTPTAAQVGLDCLQPEKDLWPVTLPAQEPDGYEIPEARPRRYERRAQERRSQTRYPVSGKAFVSAGYGGDGIWAKLEDLSLTGCYLKTTQPFAADRRLNLLLRVANSEIKASGVVRVCYPRMAMGIEFVHLGPADRRTLNDLISYLAEVESALSTLEPIS